jgi:hypothetical protein
MTSYIQSGHTGYSGFKRSLERLTRYGYNVKALSELLNVRAAEIRALLYGQLPEERTAELKQQILKTGAVEHEPIT